jgi:hypothetical protein
MAPKPKRIFLGKGRVVIEAPVIMRDEELAAILEEFVKELQARPRKESVHVNRPKPIPPPSDLPF